MALWTDEEDNILRKYYPTESMDFLLTLLKRSLYAIAKRAENIGVCKISLIRQTFFDTWSDDMAYMLGFIAADGCICIKNKGHSVYLQFCLSETDLSHLEKIRDAIYPGKKIYFTQYKLDDKIYKQCHLSIGSKYMCKKLMELGINPRKSLTLEFPKIPSEYINHFVRGYFDGDGTIGKCFTTNDWHWEILGTKCFLTSVADIIDTKFSFPHRNVRKDKKNGKIFIIQYSTQQAVKICRWLYEDSTIYLDRKYEKAQQLFSEKDKNNQEA